MKRILALIPLVLVFVLTLALGSQNGQLVQFNYLIAQGEFSLAMLLGFFFAGGFLLGWLVFGLLFPAPENAKPHPQPHHASSIPRVGAGPVTG